MDIKISKISYLSRKENIMSLFLLYVCVMLIIAFLQQEVILLPELQSFDLIGDEAKAKMLEDWQKWRWVSFTLIPILLLLRISLVTVCLFLGSFFFADMFGLKFKDWWEIAMIAQAVMILYSIIVFVINVACGESKALEVTKYTSLLFLEKDNMEQWIKLPLSSVNILEIAYWLIMAKIVSLKTESGFGKSIKFVLSSYGVGYLFYIVLLMFLILYLN